MLFVAPTRDYRHATAVAYNGAQNLTQCRDHRRKKLRDVRSMERQDASTATFRTCQLYDYARHQWLSFDGTPTTAPRVLEAEANAVSTPCR